MRNGIRLKHDPEREIYLDKHGVCMIDHDTYDKNDVLLFSIENMDEFIEVLKKVSRGIVYAGVPESMKDNPTYIGVCR